MSPSLPQAFQLPSGQAIVSAKLWYQGTTRASLHCLDLLPGTSLKVLKQLGSGLPSGRDTEVKDDCQGMDSHSVDLRPGAVLGVAWLVQGRRLCVCMLTHPL